MKKVLITSIILLMGRFIYAQDTSFLKEPEFAGEGYLIYNNKLIPIEKNKVNIATKLYWSAVGLKIVVPGCCSKVTTKSGDLELVLKVSDNSISPSSNLEITKLNSDANNRSIEYMKIGNHGRMKEGTKMETLNFEARKFGSSSYYIKLKNVSPGEYGIIFESDKKTISAGGGLKNVTGPQSILNFKVE